MSERELSDLLIRAGTGKGLPVERVVEELSSIQFPSFIDRDKFRAELLEHAQSQLRSEYETRIESLRRKVYRSDAPANVAVEQPAETSADVAGHSLTPQATRDSNAETADEGDGLDVFAPAEAGAEPAGASDETAIWVNNDGKPVRQNSSGS